MLEKSWVVYGLITKFIGRVIKEYKTSVDIRYCEGQFFPLQLWSLYAVQRFKTSNEAINYALSKSGEYSRRELTEKVLDDFPKAVKREQIQTFHDLLLSHKNNLLAQSQSKYTDPLKGHCCGED